MINSENKSCRRSKQVSPGQVNGTHLQFRYCCTDKIHSDLSFAKGITRCSDIECIHAINTDKCDEANSHFTYSLSVHSRQT